MKRCDGRPAENLNHVAPVCRDCARRDPATEGLTGPPLVPAATLPTPAHRRMRCGNKIPRHSLEPTS